MPVILQMAGAFLVLLVIIFIVGMIWFHLVEGLLNGIKKRLFPNKEPLIWHTLDEAKQQKDIKHTKE